MNYQLQRNKYNNLSDFLIKHFAKSSTLSTHTRIPNNELNIKGVSYTINEDEEGEFWFHYYERVFKKKQLEYLTEKQLKKGGGILIDFDFRYEYDIKDHVHTKEDIFNIVDLYLDKLKECFLFTDNISFPVYILEKPHVNRLENKEYTKDGIHMIIGIQMDNIHQVVLRDKVLSSIDSILRLPLTNSWDSVLDKGISEGGTNWQLIGSRKPEHEAYELTYYYNVTYDSTDGEFQTEQLQISDFDFTTDLPKMSARYREHVTFDLKSEFVKLVEDKPKSKRGPKLKKSKSSQLLPPVDDEENINADSFRLDNITSLKILENAMDNILAELLPSEYNIREIHEFVQILPAKYYEPGSHFLNRQVAFALKSKDDRLFYSWVLLRSKADDFDYADIPNLYKLWNRHFDIGDKTNPITYKSIPFWAQHDADPEDYERVKKNTVVYHLYQSLESFADYDFAKVLYHMFKDKYICSSIVNRTWYVFVDHRWKLDKGFSLRNKISEDMFYLYREKQQELLEEMADVESGSDEYIEYKNKSKVYSEVCARFKKTNDKNNIYKEVHELFYDEYFVKHMDENRYLLCCANGIIDLKNNVFRAGYPQDYITKSTHVDYLGKDLSEYQDIVDEIKDFIEKIIPIKTLNKYFWDHLASSLIGENRNQSFNIYRGSGSNGKSLFTELMEYVLGEYYGSVPVNLITDKRTAIGGTSSEIMALKGVRYAVLQEPTKGMQMNEGLMKQLTGDSKMQGRALYSETESFAIQFDLVVCCNTLFEITSNDEGTWRRIKIVDFMSKFVNDNDNVAEETSYKFKKDPNLKEKFPKWKNVFLSMLINRALETQGIVKDCEEVLVASKKYRQGQDHIAGFIAEMIGKQPGKKVGKRELIETFKVWYQEQQGNRKMPKGVEVCEYMNKKFGDIHRDGWHDIEILYPDHNDDLQDV